jgi:RIO kinase 1
MAVLSARRYVSGDFRFRASYSKHNPRKMVKVWAEKERRNLVRLQAAGIRSPQPLQLRSHVLIMDFIGTNGVAAPRLKVSIKATYISCRLVD